MQQLERRNTYTPTDIPHVRSSCDQSLKALGGRSGVTGLKTLSNNPDAALTARGQAGQNSRVAVVYVLNIRRQPLMPCKPQKARILLKKGKARVVNRTPFTIQLLYPTGETTQPITLGVDSGFLNIGLSAITALKELYVAEVLLRSDIVKLNSERRQYRRTRRYRKTWYRKPRFLNRGNKKKGWLAPSIQHKLDAHLKVIGQVRALLPLSKIVVEVAAFDIQKLKHPEIQGQQYQQGEQLGFWNVREYVLYRDGHRCQHCRGKSKDPVLNVHHIESRQTGGNRPENLITLCNTCHEKHHQGKLKFKVSPSKGFKAETFMTMVRWQLINRLRTLDLAISHTYGYLTKHSRIQQGLAKTHATDAFVIAGGNGHVRQAVQYHIKQVRKCNRKLFKGIRSHIRNIGPRYIKGFQRYDKVRYQEAECFVFGRRKSGYFDLRHLDGSKVHSSAKASDLELLESASTFLQERRVAVAAVPKQTY
jgi:N6-L-threonylcarbamoyladenine synthase